MRFYQHIFILLIVWVFPLFVSAQPSTPKGLTQTLATHILNGFTDDQNIKLRAMLSSHYNIAVGEIKDFFQSSTETEQKRINALIHFIHNEEFAPMTKTIWSKESSTFYDVHYGTIAIDSFQVTNMGDQPYKVSFGKSSCECIQINYSPMPLLPNESMMIQIEYDPARMAKVNYDYVISIEDNSELDRRKLLKLSTVFIKSNLTKKKPPKP